MKAKNYFNILSTTLIFLNFSLSSCGGNNFKDKPAPLKNQVGTILELSSKLDSQEKRVAKRICDALRVKRATIYEKNLIGTVRTLDIKRKYCEQATASYQLSVVLQSNNLDELLYVNSTDKFYLKVVQTHIGGELSSICPSLLRGEDPSLVLSQSLEIVKQVNFSSSGGDHFSVIAAKLISTGGANKYQITSLTKYNVETQSGGQLGEVTSVRKDDLCSDEMKSKYITQKLL